MATKIRDAALEDVGLLAALAFAVHSMHMAWRPETFRAASVEEMQSLFRQWLEQDNFRAYLALLDDLPVGYVAVRVVDRAGNILMNRRRFLDIEQIGVVPDERGKGIGKALLEKAKEFARQQGLPRIELNVWAENVGAQRAFAAWGFQSQSERMALELEPSVQGIRHKETNIITETPRSARPTLDTSRMILRPFALYDAADVQRLAGDRQVASTTLRIPHPYEDGMAEAWIGTHEEAFEKGKAVDWAVTLREGGTLVGAIGLSGISREHRHAEIGYWIGVPYWGHGYCTEAARAVLQYGFEVLALQRIFSHHLARNPASGRVMHKLGMTHEGRRRKHVRKWEVFEDVEAWAILRDAWEQARRAGTRGRGQGGAAS